MEKNKNAKSGRACSFSDMDGAKNKFLDEVLELVWTKSEDGPVTKDGLLKSDDPVISEDLLKKIIDEGYLLEVKNEIVLGEKGKEKAAQLIRAHRLSERLFVDVLDLGDESIESNACTFEHILSPEILTGICTLLGHPTECPHGRPIPPGECCRQSVKNVKSIVFAMSELQVGEKARIMYIATKNHARLDQLTALGISPGKIVRLHQKMPSYVISAGETDIALDSEILDDIYVRKV